MSFLSRKPFFDSSMTWISKICQFNWAETTLFYKVHGREETWQTRFRDSSWNLRSHACHVAPTADFRESKATARSSAGQVEIWHKVLRTCAMQLLWVAYARMPCQDYLTDGIPLRRSLNQDWTWLGNLQLLWSDMGHGKTLGLRDAAFALPWPARYCNNYLYVVSEPYTSR